MSDNTERWIIIPRWEHFQHRDAARSQQLAWIKVYVRLLDDDDYLRLTGSQRALLHELWLLYATHRRVLSESVARSKLVRNSGEAKYWIRNLKALNDAGWLTFSASHPASKHASNLLALEVEREKESFSREESRARASRRAETRPQPQIRSQPGRTNLPQRVTAEVLERWIRAGAIADLAVLEHEIEEAKVSVSDAERLRALLPQAGTHDGPPTLGHDLSANH